MLCRHCRSPLNYVFLDLGSAPPSNAYLSEEDLNKPEKWYPLRVLICQHCWLAQTEDFAQASELFNPNYAYFSGYSKTWLEHCKNFAHDSISRFQLTKESHVVEVASNDGYLLQYFQSANIDCLGVEPTSSTANAARAKGIYVVEDFFGVELARKLADQGKKADFTVANNVLAHVPDINDFVKGFSLLLKPHGVATFEFPHLLKLVENHQFDTIYHEHFSYLSATATCEIFKTNDLTVFDIEELPTHGGSLRIYAELARSGKNKPSSRMKLILDEERERGLQCVDYYLDFQTKAELIKDELLGFLLSAKRQGRTVAAYGAAAKGNTLLNFAGVRPDMLKFVVDANPAKQGKFLPGSRIPIVSERTLKATKPDYIIILPWNLNREIRLQLKYCSEWGARFITAIPSLDITPPLPIKP